MIYSPKPGAAAWLVPLCRACSESGSCAARACDYQINASVAGPGASLSRYVSMPSLDLMCFAQSPSHLPANDDRHEVIKRFKQNIGALERAPSETILETGCLDELLLKLPLWLGRKSVFKLAGDLPAYNNRMAGLPVFEIGIDLFEPDVDASQVARGIEGASSPIIYLTFPMTDPNQQRMSIGVIDAILKTNPEAIVVIDNSRRSFYEMAGLAAYARINDRVIYVDAATADLISTDPRVGWMTASPGLLARIAPHLSTCTTSAASLVQANALIESPEAIGQIVDTVTSARDLLAGRLRGLGFPIRTGLGRWVMIQFGNRAPSFVQRLAEGHNILVQQLTGPLRGWVRVSATVPCEAEQISMALLMLIAEDATGRANQAYIADLHAGRLDRLINSFGKPEGILLPHQQPPDDIGRTAHLF